MIYHILSPSIFTQRLVELLIRHKERVNLDDHMFLIIGKKKKFPVEVLNSLNYVTYNSDRDFKLYFALLRLKARDRLICHSLDFPFFIIFCGIFRRITSRIVWRIWGGDLYFFKFRSKTLKHCVLEFFRKIVIKRIPIIATPIRGDFDIAVNVYSSKAKYCFAIYPKTNITEFSERQISNEIRILAGNSIDDTNNHLDILYVLEKFKEENLRIIMPLSYGSVTFGSTDAYVDNVIRIGKDIFGSKFVPLLDYLNPSSYSKLLNGIDILILNHQRQQALGNIFPLLALKRKVYIRGDVSTYHYFNNLGVKVFDTNAIVNEDFETFTFFSKIVGENNSEIVRNIISEENTIDSWEKLFLLQL